jgi:hypothetical protein
MKRPEAFPLLYRLGGEASRFAYGSITATASGHALAQIAAGRRSVQVTGAVTDHPHRFSQALQHLLRLPQARVEMRALLDSYEQPAAPPIVSSLDSYISGDDVEFPEARDRVLVIVDRICDDRNLTPEERAVFEGKASLAFDQYGEEGAKGYIAGALASLPLHV